MDAHANSLLSWAYECQAVACASGAWAGERNKVTPYDTIAGDLLMDVYHVPLQAYQTATQDDLLPEHGSDVIDAGMTTYTDDAELISSF